MNTDVAVRVAMELMTQGLVMALLSLPLALPTLWAAFKLLLPRIQNAPLRAAMEALEAAAKPAVSMAAEHVRAELIKARLPGSPGGVAVTREELSRAVASGVMVAWNILDKQKLLRSVVDAYGGEEVVKASIRSIITTSLMDKHGVDANKVMAE